MKDCERKELFNKWDELIAKIDAEDKQGAPINEELRKEVIDFLNDTLIKNLHKEEGKS